MEHLFWEIVMFAVSFPAVMLGVLGLPGNFVPVIAVLLTVLFGDGSAFGWGWFAVFLAVAVSGEIVDQITGVLGAKKSGATRAGMMGAAVGGIAGGILGTLVLPVIGSFIGVFVGCFALTFVFEYLFSRRSTQESGRAGIGAVMGKAVATVYKLLAGFTLLVFMAWRFWMR